ncbi:hypothetical protein EDM57_04310 [Brevibacillus gelatini]|uniref:Uncharacterized protein n=1 Tax=Brevibacillus gelatini TaxID=1655277 RepID=A0A3M8B7U0_9BACL|nr:hypothetical protein [Brevibacillus gelatini]RNB59372.1 hypothetical protein EDM57_04310 [Brevibacillus gelatini]
MININTYKIIDKLVDICVFTFNQGQEYWNKREEDIADDIWKSHDKIVDLIADILVLDKERREDLIWYIQELENQNVTKDELFKEFNIKETTSSISNLTINVSANANTLASDIAEAISRALTVTADKISI